ncbi:MAG: hypothetical protein JWO36_1819 [Myxococcales bacterium]|nr:hypothetical protein [Myxococcales bacterium]
MTTSQRSIVLVVLALVMLLGTAKSRADDSSSGRTFAGSLQLDYLSVPTDRHARDTTLDGATVELSLKLTKDFSKDFSASVKVCFACHGFEAGMAFVEYRAADELRIKVGRMTPAFGSFPLRHDPANHLTSDKPLPYDMGRMIRRNDWNEGILPAPWVDNGIEVAGTHFMDGGQLDYAVYAVSGPKGTPDAVDFDFVESRSPSQYYVDNNSEPSLGARISGSIDLTDSSILVVGASGMAGHYDAERKLGFMIAGGDAVLQVGSAYLRAEYLIRRTQMALGDNPATTFKYGPGANGKFDDWFLKDGFYVEGELPVGSTSLIARWDGLRRDGNVLAASPLSSYSRIFRYTAGVAVKLKSGIRIKSSVELYDFSDFQDELAVHLGVATPF